MRICLISVEIFAWGKYGGFGRATRLIGRELAKRGIEVTAIVPRRKDQRPVENLDGIRVLSFKPSELFSATNLFRQANADIYHSEEPSLGTYLAMRAMPDRKHIITFRDPRDSQDWRTEFRLPSLNPAQVIANWLYEDNWLVENAVRHAHGWYAAANMLVPKARKKYHLLVDPKFLPTPVVIPQELHKSSTPTACFVSRLDKRKRPEIFFELARSFPDVHFLAAGRSRNPQWDEHLRSTYAHLPNLEMLGFIDQFSNNDLAQLLERSWILINTAVREGLPNSFIEAAAHGCAILSSVDPDGFASHFGYNAQKDDFVTGLQALLKDNTWEARGRLGREHVRQQFESGKAIDQHIRLYQGLLGLPVGDPGHIS
jgi:glycosyltransferase involved in cell wall biosynthesis